MAFINLKREVQRLNNRLEGISDDLVIALEKYQREYERLLLKTNFDVKNNNFKATVSNFNKAQSLNPMSKLGFNQIAIDHIRQYTPAAKAQIKWNKRVGIKFDMKISDIAGLTALRETDYAALLGQANLMDAQIKQQLVNAIALQANYSDTVEGLATQMLGVGGRSGMLAKYANTYMRTALFGVTRVVDKEIYNKVGGNEPKSIYEYAGPVDGKTRPFCLSHVGKKFTKKKVDNFPVENGSGLDPFVAPGGWNCRHRLVLVQ